MKVGPSPDWLKRRLESVGCRSVNNIVDITNYILFESGEPLHAFDLDKIVSRLTGLGSPLEIVVRRAKPKEEIITIDGIKRILNEQILVIASAAGQPIAVAGLMGGKDTEVDKNTKNVLLEAAVFNPVVIRRSRQILGIQSDSSYRFERGVDAQSVPVVSGKAAQLIQQLAAGDCTAVKSCGHTGIKGKTIQLDTDNIERALGVKVPQAQIKSILSRLGFKLTKKGKRKFQVVVPGHRQDVKLEIDLTEEVSRIFGYARIPVSLPSVKPEIGINLPRDITSLIRNTLMGLGLNEVITYSLIDGDWLGDFDFSFSRPVEILNPLSKEQEILRPSLIPSLCRCVAHNLNQKQECVAIFEIAKKYSIADKALPSESLALGIALCGEKTMLLENGAIREKLGLRHLKGAIVSVLERLGIETCDFAGNSQNISIKAGNETIGIMRQLSRRTLESIGIKNKELAAAEINLEQIFLSANLCKQFSPLPKFPGIVRDISILVKEDVMFDQLLRAIAEQGKAWLRYENIGLKDNYSGKQVPAGYKALTISCLYRSAERTLTEEEVNPGHQAVVEMLKAEFGAQVR